MIDACNTAVVAGMVGAFGGFDDATVHIESAGKFGAELKAIVRKEGKRASPKGDVAVDQYVGRDGCITIQPSQVL